MSKFSLEPLRWLLHPVALLAFAAAAQAWIDGANTRGIIVAVIGVLVAAATEAARSKVTPTARLAGAQGAGRRSSWGRQDGYGLVELLVAVILILLLVWLVIALVPDADAAAVAFRSSWG